MNAKENGASIHKKNLKEQAETEQKTFLKEYQFKKAKHGAGPVAVRAPCS